MVETFTGNIVPHLLEYSNISKYTQWKDPELRAKRISESLTGKKQSKEQIQKLSKRKRYPSSYKKMVETRRLRGGYVISPECRLKISRALKGRPFSEEHKRKLRLQALARSPEAYKKAVETKKKLGLYKISPEHLEKLRLSHIGKRPSLETVLKHSQTLLGFNIEDFKNEIIDAYNRGDSSKIIAKKYGTYGPVIIGWLKKWGIHIRRSVFPHYVGHTAEDGHTVLSTTESIIDNFLFDNNIKHITNKQLLKTKYRFDFYLPEYDTYIEYWGLSEIPQYFEKRQDKEKIYRENNLYCINIEPTDNPVVIIKEHLERRERKKVAEEAEEER